MEREGGGGKSLFGHTEKGDGEPQKSSLIFLHWLLLLYIERKQWMMSPNRIRDVLALESSLRKAQRGMNRKLVIDTWFFQRHDHIYLDPLICCNTLWKVCDGAEGGRIALNLSLFFFRFWRQSRAEAPCSQGGVEKTLDHREGENKRALWGKKKMATLYQQSLL